MRKLWFDTETGGLNPRIHSLLTAYFAVCDENLKIIDELDLQLKPEDLSKLNVTKEAMDINKINLEEHLADPKTIPYTEGAKQLTEFLTRNKIKGKKKSFMPCGHNIQFDKEMVWEQMMSQEDWEKTVHYRTLDTSIVCAFLKDLGYFPADLGSLESIVEYLELPKGEVHNARGDVLMNIEVYRAILTLLKEKKTNMVGGSSNSLLQIIEE